MSTNAGATESTVVSSEPPRNSDVAASNQVRVLVSAGSLVSISETLATEPSSGGEIGVVMVNDEKVLYDSSLDAVVSSVPPAASDEVKIGDDLLELKSGTLIMESSDHGGGDIIVQDLIDEARVSVMNNSELVLDRLISEAGVSSEPVSNRDIDTVNEVNIGTDLLGSETETLKMKPSADHNGDGDTVIHDSVDASSVSKDEKEVIMENIEKVSDENEVNMEEKEGEYKVTDIVWAKVKDYPWWPGQIFDPSSSTDKAKKYSNKKGLLVGYFGDQTFAWNKPSNIKPFRKNFSKLVKQGNSKAFFHAVDCALDEVSRRVDFGLACSCLSKEAYCKIKSQDFVNAGITKEASKIDGGDRFSTVSSFKPVKVVQSVKELAREHFDGFNRLEVLSVRTQLLAFFRWKGYYQFQAQNLLDELDNKLEDESEVPLTEEKKVVEDEKPASVGKKVSSKKRKPDVSDSDDSEESVPCKKERSLKNVTPKGNSSVKRSKKCISKKATSEDNVIKEENGKEKPVSVGKKVKSKKREPDVCDGDDSEDSVPRKKERSLTNVTPKGSSSLRRSKQSISRKVTVEDNGNEKPVSGGKKVSSKKTKPDVSDSDSDDSDDSVPRKKERSLTNVTPKGNSSVKRSKQSISKKATFKDNENEKPVSDSDDSEDSVPCKKERSKQSISKKATVEDNGNEKTVSGGKKVSSRKGKPDVSDSDRDDSVPRKKERSLTNVTPKNNSSVKRSKQSISKKATVEDNGSEKSVSGGKKVSSRKTKPDVSDSDSDDSIPHKKERSLKNVTSKINSSVKRSKKGISKKSTVEDNVSKEENGNGTDDKKSSNSSPKRLFSVGDSICRIAKQISESPSILKKESQKSKNDDEESC